MFFAVLPVSSFFFVKQKIQWPWYSYFVYFTRTIFAIFLLIYATLIHNTLTYLYISKVHGHCERSHDVIYREKHIQPITKQRSSFFFPHIYYNNLIRLLFWLLDPMCEPHPRKTHHCVIDKLTKLWQYFPIVTTPLRKIIWPQQQNTKEKQTQNLEKKKNRLYRCFGTYGNTVWVFSSDLITFGTSLLEWMLFLVLELHIWIVAWLLNCSRRIF